MLLTLAAALVALHGTPAPTSALAADTLPAGSYRDATARELVARAREYRRMADRGVSEYQVVGRERVAVGLRAVGRDREVYSSEHAARVNWQREGPIRIEVLGARESNPGEVDVLPDGLMGEVKDLAFDPADSRLKVGIFEGQWVRHPLAEGSEAFYRYRTGDTLQVRLPQGTTVRVFELRVEPRRLDVPLVSGSIWLDDRSYGIVRTLLRLSGSLTEEIRAEIDDDEEGRRNLSVGADLSDSARAGRRGGFRTAWIPDVRLDVKYVTTEYALVQGRWWMPTLSALEGTVSVGSWVQAPVRWERSYTGYRVAGDTAAPLVEVPAADPADSLAPLRPGAVALQECKDTEGCACIRGVCRIYEVQVPADTAALVRSPELPPSFGDNARLMTGKEADELEDELSRVARAPWILSTPSLTQSPVLLRYNRVEELSVGTRGVLDFGALRVDGTARISTGAWEPDLEVGVLRDGPERRVRVAGYRRLAAADPAARPFGIGNSLGALLWGRDDGDYFRALGVDLTVLPSRADRDWYEWRLFAERQRAVTAETDVSLRGVFDDGFGFRPNLEADRADQVGAALTLRPVEGARFLGAEWGLTAYAEGQAGTFRFARPSLALRAGVPLPGRLVGALEGAAGTSFGDVPAQGLWRLGGPPTLRGYDASTATGEAFWRGRAEVGTEMRAARLTLFTDVGWAGSRDDVSFDRPLWSVGAGFSVLDGLVRMDVAHGLREPRGWRADLYVNGVL